MFFQIAQPLNTKQFLARLNDMEQIQIRLAQSEERLDHMRQTQFAADMITQQTMLDAHAELMDRFANHPQTGGF